MSSSNTVHLFSDSLKRGADGEDVLDKYFSDVYEYKIKKSSFADERRGIDRWFGRENTSLNIPVQYKTDDAASKTGNAFIETVSVGENMIQKGWVYSCEAQLLVYFVPGLKKAILLNPKNLRGAVDDWLAKYRVRPARNKDYWTYGILVPLAEIEKESLMVYAPVPCEIANE